MHLKIIAIKDGGDPDKERILLQADHYCNIGKYILLARKAGYPFIFPQLSVQSGDYVRVFTKPGIAFEKPARYNNGQLVSRPFHTFFWGEDRSIWDEEGDEALLILATERQSFVSAPTEDPASAVEGAGIK